MDIGKFDYDKAKSKARVFLEESIHTLGLLLNIDPSSITSESVCPFEENSPMYQVWVCLYEEISALKTIAE